MSAQASLTTTATARVRAAFEMFPAARAAQLKAKALYTYILHQARAALTAAEGITSPDGELLFKLRLSVRALEKAVEIKSGYVSFIEAQLAGFKAGLDEGGIHLQRGGNENIHWDATALIAFVDGFETAFGEEVEGWEKKGKVVEKLVGGEWLERMEEAEEKGVVELGAGLAAAVVGGGMNIVVEDLEE